MSKLTNPQIKELSEILYDRTKDFISTEVVEMLYDEGLIEELDDDATDLLNKVMEQYWSHHIVKNW